MQSLWLLTQKNLRLLLRAKASALIVIFAPLLIILLLGLSYNASDKYGLKIGVYALSESEDVNSFITLLQEEEYEIIKYVASKEECVEDVKRGLINTCIFLPESLKIEDNTQKEITFYLDPTKINLVWMIQETVKSKFNLKSAEISQSLSQDLLTRLSDTNSKLNTKKADVDIIKSKAGTASSSTESAKSGLSGLDLTAPVSTYDTGLIANVTADLNTAAKSLNNALSAVSSANITSGKSAITTPLNEALSKLKGINDNVNGASGLANIISSLQTDLELARTKLTTASSAVEQTNADLVAVSTALAEGVSALDSLQTGLNEITANLEAQKVTQAGTISSPLLMKIETVSEKGTFLNYLFPAILVLVVMFSSLLLGTTLVMMEKNSPAFLRNFFLPISKTTFIISTYLTNLILIIFQIVIILGLSLFFLDNALLALPAMALILFLAASVFTFLGMLIGYVFVSEETGVLASISMGSIFLFISGVILPLEGISATLRAITSYNPFVIAEKLIREVFIFGTSLSDLWLDLTLLVGYAVVLFLIILVVESVLHQHLVHRFLKQHHLKHGKGIKQADEKEKTNSSL